MTRYVNPRQPWTGAKDLWKTAAIAAFGVGLTWYSIFGGLAAMLILTAARSAEPWRTRLLIALSVLALALFSLLKRPEADELYYLWYLDGIREAGLRATLSWIEFSIRRTEPLFIGYALFFAAIPGGKPLFVFVSAVIIFAVPGLVFARLARERIGDPIVPVAFAFLVSISVFSAGHLIRQYLALAIFTFALWDWLSGKTLKSFGFTLLSIAIHNSNAVLLFPLTMGALFRRYPRLTLMAFVIVAVAGRMILSPLADFAKSFDKQDGVVPLWLLAIDIGLVSALLAIWWRVRWQDQMLDRTAGFTLAMIALLAAVSNLQLLFLRTYIFIEFWRPVVLIMVLSRTDLHRNLFVRSVIIAASAAIFLFRLNGTPWNYGPDPASILSIGMSGYINRQGLLFAQ